MASWKKVIVSGSAAELASLTLDTPLASGNVATLNQDTTGNAATATKLAAAVNIAGVAFDGSGNISLNNNAITNGAGYITSATDTVDMGDGFVIEDADGTEVTITENKEIKFTGTGGLTINFTDTTPGSDADPFDLEFAIGTLNQDTTGKAATADALETARNIGGVSFDGSANIDLPGVNTAGNQSTTGNAATATALASSVNIAGVAFDGSGNISLNNNAITNGAGYITTAGTVDDVSIANLKTRLAGGFGSNAVTIGDSDDVVTIGNKLVVTGDLTVSGTTTTVDTANLNVTDQFINLNDGGGAADGGLVVEGAGVSYGWDNSAGRWAFDAAGATEGQTSITADAYASAVVTTDLAAYRKNGNIRVTANEIYIYVE